MRPTGKSARLFAGLALGGLALSGPLASAQAPMPAWAQATSDLTADPAVTFGVLPNGLRYAIMPNKTPPGQVSMRLLIRAGSMHEGKGQEGLAHVLEHLAFRGSNHLTDGDVFPKLERLGLARGADSNAGTGSNQTVYQFDLPKSDAETVDAGLMVLREIAGELLLKPEAMDSERSVVLSEERLRDNPNLHAGKALNKQILGDHPFARLPIGERAVIQTAPVSRVRAFYDAYYRPERAFLVISGDIDANALSDRISAKFSDWRGKGPAGRDPAPVTKPQPSTTQFYAEAGLSPQMILSWAGPPQDAKDTRAFEIDRIQESLAFSVLNKRFSDLSSGPKPPFLGANANGVEVRHVVRMTQMAAIAPTDWRVALKALIATQRQALTYGIQKEELDRVITQNRTGLQSAVAGAGSRRTPALVGGLVAAAQSDQVYRNPQQRLELFEDAVRTITLDKANALLRARFTGAGPSVFLALPSAAGASQAELETTVAQAQSQSISQLAEVSLKPWPYTDFGPAGRVVEQRGIEDVGVTLVTFANGVRLAVKPTDFTASSILVRVRTGYGLLDVPSDRLIALDGLGTRVGEGGLVDLTPTEVRRSLEGKVVGAGVGTGEEGFGFTGVTRQQDLVLQMQVLAAYHTKPGWRTDGLAERLELARTVYPQAETTPSGVFSREAGLLLHAGDARWRQPNPDEMSAMQPEDVRAFMTPILAKAPIEIVMVGDLSVDQAIAAVAKTFGALPQRDTRGPHPAGRIVSFPAPNATPVVMRHRGRADQALAVAAWPTTGFHDHDAQIRLRLLQLIINDRLFDQLRTKEGKTYSPQGDLAASTAFPAYGYMLVMLETPPGDVASVLASIDRITEDLAAKEVSADELERVRKPRIELWRRNLRTNEYWASALSNVFDDGDALTAARNNITDFGKVTPAELRALAARYLRPDKAFRITVVPRAETVAGGTTP